MPLSAPYLPVEVTDTQMAFPADALDRMPEWDDIPAEFRLGGTWQERLWRDVFYLGLEAISLTPAEGIEAEKAWRHLQSIVGSYAPKHEHKMAALAYLTSLWFRGARWRANPSKHDPDKKQPWWQHGDFPEQHPDEAKAEA